MVFSSSIFLFAFLPTVILIYTLIRRFRMASNIFLFIVSLFFYAWGEPRFVLVMLLSIIASYLFGLLIHKYRFSARLSRLFLVLILIFDFGTLFIFKYLNFTVNNLNYFGLNLPYPGIVLPIGISFFTFHAASYVIDIYRGTVDVQKNPLNVGLYIAFFPQLLAGPIVRFHDIADQIKNRKENLEDFGYGCLRFTFGLAKKVMIANTLAALANLAFAAKPASLTVGLAWLGVLAYTFQIYFDFSGYSDMAIGLGRMFGFHFNENFNYPYTAISATDFWRKWHISLSSWFRDYVYFPMGGSRVKSKGRLVFNLLVVWFLTGFWHCASWNFIVWGLFWFALITLEKLTGFIKKIPTRLSFLSHIYAMTAVILGWVLFRANGLRYALKYLLALFGLAGNSLWDAVASSWLCEYAVVLVMAVLFCLPVFKVVPERIRGRAAWGYARIAAMTLLMVASIAYIVKGTYNPFIYFNF